jgi:Bacterial regulatory proteins, luxR family
LAGRCAASDQYQHLDLTGGSGQELIRAVARALHITPKTAGNHIERIYAKIGASSRSTATLFAMRHGMLATLEPVHS